MIRRIQFAAIIIMTAILASCGQSGKKTGSLPPVKIEIPSELKDKPEVVEFIKESEKTINEFTVTVEEMVEKMKPYADKDFDELGMAIKMRLMAIMGAAAMSFAEFTVKQAEIVEKGRYFEGRLDENHGQAIGMVLHTFAERLELLDKKFKEIDKK